MKAKLLWAAAIVLWSLAACNKEDLSSSDVRKGETTGLKAGTAVNWYLTRADGSIKFTQQSSLNWTTATNSYPSITLNESTRYQTMDGFGFTLTEGSAEVISSLSSTTQTTLLNELFSTNGIGISVLRISIGASDLSSSSYSYQEMAPYSGTTAPVGAFIRLKGVTNGRYVTSNDGASAMICDRSSASSWETFEVVDAGGGLIALRGSNGKYVSGTSPMYCNASSIGATEKFSWISPAGGQVQLKCSANNYFVCSENGTTSMNCNRTSASGWETFSVEAAIFSLNGPDLTYLIPILKKALAINSGIKILATPWSAPRWMKSNQAWVGGELMTSYYQAYANYFKRYLDAMKAQGINIWAITPQNEPLHGGNEPSMTMTKEQQLSFINSHLGPTLRNAGYSTLIIAYDHNCDNTEYPIYVCNNSSYVDGAAFHLYAGSIAALTTVRNATGKNVYFTEQYTSSTGSFSGDFPWHMQNVMIGAPNNWAKIALEWNLATNTSYGPRTPGGCTTCLGAITVNNSTSYTRNVSYYVCAHLSKFVRPNAQRIHSTTTDASLVNVAFANGSDRIVVVYNTASTSKTFNIVHNGSKVVVTLPANSAGTFVWQTTQASLLCTIEAENYSSMNGIQTENCSEGGLNVGWIDAGDWMAYNNINFPISGTYRIEYRVASISGATLSSDLNAGSIQLGQVTIPATGGWQNWTTVSQTVTINAGTYSFGIFAVTGGWNINWIKIYQ